MMRSLFSGVTGLRSHQTRMDVIGNNIANVNTVGYKKSTVTFKDLYSETISAAAAASGAGAGTTGGVNPKQIGLGAAVNSISVVHTPGSAQYTGNGMDVAISGDGYFVVQTPTGNMYTRAGNFYTDQAGNLVTADGYYVQTVLPSTSAVMQYSLNNVLSDTMKNQIGGITAPSGGVIQSGNVTADLENTIGKTYHFRFTEDAKAPWTATMNASNFMPKGNGDVAVTSSGWSNTNLQAAVEAAAQANPNTAKEGSLKMSFVQDGTDIHLMVGSLNLGTASIASIDAGDSATLNFGSFSLDVTNSNTTDAIDTKAIADALKTSDMPDISLVQNGTWEMVDNDGTVVDKVIMSTTAASGGGLQGNFKITTTEFGNFSLSIANSEVLANNSVLSQRLADSYFSLDVDSEWGVEYSSPGAVLEGALQTMKIDFDMYSDLAIDSKGAIVAQLKQDQQITVDGQTIKMVAGDKVVLGYIALANFNNPAGLEKMGDNLYAASANSGTPAFNMPGTGSAGQLSPSNLEMSNVDLSEEIVNMIITQRGFQANSRIITTTDTMLEELVNLKR
ncbi:MAG: flagellar hook-basal body complex protein [Clostridia bacterium]|nr:flagellar hook-basal body complex protein [Candidatus Pelethousia sp.]NCB31116.1 flagellar hook-basal body complex protein [Clostridia bacterium]